MTVEFNTREYFKSHAREPRGRGMWAFSLSTHGDGTIEWSPSMTYGEARRWARSHFKALAIAADAPADLLIEVYVLP
jgi:hypothetical protein